MEIAYLLYSEREKKAFYITQVPNYDMDLSGTRTGVYDMPLYRIDNFLNVSHFNTFFCLTVSEDSLNFNAGRKKGSWLFKKSADGNSVTITDVNFTKGRKERNYPVNPSLAFPIVFYKRDNWSIGYSNDFKQQTLTAGHVTYLHRRGVYFSTSKLGYTVKPDFPLFEFERDLAVGENRYRWIYFRSARLKSSIWSKYK
ncbi:hypothetical protein [Chitinophaga pinensis]|uniref:Uncharacterized protein n=1 Tax=Chitinophaga pinensis TaxID=79329 RepID=A0A5C6LKQ3_9BACT|nr:hypothetical protein [Chitinophaga pinensis]TWV95121.1 hypothetical protein FEF09_24960 [Chitinophaga pinensis]